MRTSNPELVRRFLRWFIVVAVIVGWPAVGYASKVHGMAALVIFLAVIAAIVWALVVHSELRPPMHHRVK